MFINSRSLMTGRAIGQLGTMTNQGFGVTNQRFRIPLEPCCSPPVFLFGQHTSMQALSTAGDMAVFKSQVLHFQFTVRARRHSCWI